MRPTLCPPTGPDSGAAARAAAERARARAQVAAETLEVALAYRPDDVVVGLLAVAFPDAPTHRDAEVRAEALARALRAAFGTGPGDRAADADLVGWLTAPHGGLGGRTPLEAVAGGWANAVRAAVPTALAWRIEHWLRV